MMYKTALIVAFVGTAIASLVVEPEPPVDFSQHQIVKILPKRFGDLQRLHRLQDVFDTKVDFWGPLMRDMRPVLSLVGPDGGQDFLRALNGSRIQYEVVANSFQKVIDEERAANEKSALYSTRDYDYDTVYHTYEDIVAEINTLQSKSNKVKTGVVGKTTQGRDIPYISITNPNGGNKKVIFFECGIHSREWVTTAACMWISNQLISTTTYDKYLDKYEFIIVPTLNSDGYVYTWTTNRNWRKTRSQNGLCYGADPNRNWDASFCTQGASTNPCSDTYCGKSAFSEPEAKAMSELVKKSQGNIAAYFAIHSYSQLWMYPWGYKYDEPSNSKQLNDISKSSVAAIKATNGLTFQYGSIANTIYIASGSSIDWAYDKAGVQISFALELRDTGKYGFILPPEQILPASKETWAGLRAAIDNLP